MNNEWQPIETAPKDGSIIMLRDEHKTCTCAMAWNKKFKRWEGVAYSMMRSVKTTWDESFVAIYEWQHWA